MRRSFDWTARWADAIISDKRPVYKWLCTELGRHAHLIYYLADLCTVPGDEALHEYHVAAGEYILYVGGLIPDKGPHVLVEAYERLETEKRLVIVGDTAYFSDYTGKLRATKDPRIVFTGYAYGAKYRQLLQHAYVYAHPFLAEGTSPALLQAMAARNCVIVGDLPETLDVVGDAALVFQVGDPADLRRQLAWALAHPEEVAQLRARARQRVETRFSWQLVAEQHAAVYLEVRGSRSRAGWARAPADG